MPKRSKFTDPILVAYESALEERPHDLSLKKTFAKLLVEHDYPYNAYELIKKILTQDTDLEMERLLADLKKSLILAEVLDPDTDAPLVPPAGTKTGPSFDDVAGMQEVKEAIRMDIIYPAKNPELFAAYGREKGGGGILLYGPPGCGKTMIAKATAAEMQRDFISVAVHDTLMAHFGDSERALADIFKKARRLAPCVLFLDEIDAIASGRSRGGANMRTLVTTLLTQMDGFSGAHDGVLVIGATNVPWELDDALRRPGRFTRQIFVGPPCAEARRRIFELELAQVPHNISSLDAVVAATRHKSGADIKGALYRASDQALREAVKTGTIAPVTEAMLLQACTNTPSSALEWFTTAKAYVRFSNATGRYDEVKQFMEREGVEV